MEFTAITPEGRKIDVTIDENTGRMEMYIAPFLYVGEAMFNEDCVPQMQSENYVPGWIIDSVNRTMREMFG